MWARRGGPGYHGLGRASGGYPYKGSRIKLRHPPARIPASDIHGLRHPRRGPAGVLPCRPSRYIMRGQAGASKLIGYWPLTWSAGTIYICGVGAAQGHGEGRVATMFLYHTVGLVWGVGGVHYGDMEAMKAEGQAKLEPPRNPGYASTGYCVLAVGPLESGVVGSYEYATGSGLRGVTGGDRLHGGGGMRTKRGPLLLRRMRAALYLGCCFAPIGDALAFCLLLCCRRGSPQAVVTTSTSSGPYTLPWRLPLTLTCTDWPAPVVAPLPPQQRPGRRFGPHRRRGEPTYSIGPRVTPWTTLHVTCSRPDRRPPVVCCCSEDYVDCTYIEATAYSVLRRRVVPPSQRRCHPRAATARTTATARPWSDG